MAVNETVCAVAELYAHDRVLKSALAIDVMIGVTTVILLAIVLKQPAFRTMAIHPNLKILLANILLTFIIVSVILCVIHSRFLIMFYIYKDGCELVVPPWLIAIGRGATFTYGTAFPMWHLAFTLERIFATKRVKKYEGTGIAFGILAMIIVWLISVGSTSYIIAAAYQEEGFRKGSPFLTLTTKTTAGIILVRTYSILVLDCITVIVDVAIALANKKRMNKITAEYSLSQSYQTNENVVVTMRLILPLDICNASLFIASKVADSLFRQPGLFDVTPVRLQALLDLTFAATYLQLPLSLLILLRFCRKLKRNAVIIDQKSESELFFEQFRKQIESAMPSTPKAVAAESASSQ